MTVCADTSRHEWKGVRRDRGNHPGRGLVRRFGKVRALDGLTLLARAGQVTAVLGPNGAGKTTFLRTVATLTKPDAGRLHVAGVDVIRHPE